MGNEIWPSAVDHVKAVQCLDRVANDNVVRACVIERASLGLPLAASGQNAIVFSLRHALRIDGQARPVLLMEWIDGAPLHRAIDARLGDAAALLSLAHEWVVLPRPMPRPVQKFRASPRTSRRGAASEEAVHVDRPLRRSLPKGRLP